MGPKTNRKSGHDRKVYFDFSSQINLIESSYYWKYGLEAGPELKMQGFAFDSVNKCI